MTFRTSFFSLQQAAAAAVSMQYTSRISLVLRALALVCLVISLISCLMNDIWYQYTFPTIGFVSAFFATLAVVAAIVAIVMRTKNEVLLMYPVKVAIIVLPMLLSLMATISFAVVVQVCVSLFVIPCFIFYNSPTLTIAMIFSGICFFILVIELMLLLCTTEKYITEENATQNGPANISFDKNDKPQSAIIVNPQFKQAYITRNPPVQTDL